MSYIPRVGRPPKWESLEELESAIEHYFNSCVSPVMLTVDNPEYDQEAADAAKENEEEYDVPKRIRVQKLDGNGVPVYEQIEPLTITGLALALGTTRTTLLDHEKEMVENVPEELRPQFSDAIKKAKSYIENYLEKYMYSGKNQTSAIFVAKNNFGWRDRTETDLTSKGEKIEGNVITFAKQDVKKD